VALHDFRTGCGFTVLLAGLLSTPLQAQTTNWSTGTGSWFSAGNWDSGMPTPATTNSNVTNGGTAQIAGGAANTGNTLTISGGSTVDLQAGGSLSGGTVVLGNNGTLLLSGSTAVGANCVPSPGCVGLPFSGIEFSGGTVRATTTGSMPASIRFAPDASGTILATSGQTLTISGDLYILGNFFGNNVHLTFGSTTDTGTIVFAPVVVGASFPPGNDGTIEVAGGTLRSGNIGFGGIGSTARATIVDAGAKLDLSPNPTQTVFNLLGAGQVLTGNNPSAILTINQGVFSGQITGAAQVQVAAELFTCAFFCPTIIGTLRLSGVNTYTGGTTISSGILEIGNIDSLGIGPVTIDGATSLHSWLRSSVSGTLTNDFTLQGRVGISATAGQTLTLASGILTFASNSNNVVRFGTLTDTGTIVFAPSAISMLAPYTVEIDGGTLRVDGSIATSSLTTVNAGATLGGNGIVADTVINGGTLSPGNSIGTLTVQGSLVFTAASTYLVEVSATNADRVNVTGTATLGGATVNASFAAGTYVAKQYTILNGAPTNHWRWRMRS
jgi:autotransporter-associated beta strand protein